MKAKDLFDGHYVALIPRDDTWLVGLHNPESTMLWPETYRDLADALDAVREWADLLSNETEIHASIEATVTPARQMSGPDRMEDDETAPVDMDALTTWFENDLRHGS